MTQAQGNEYEQERRGKLERLRGLGVDPYGRAEPGVVTLAAARGAYKPEMGHDGGPSFTVAGRIVLKRDMGKLSFLTIRDESGDLQVGIDRKKVDDLSWEVRNLLDLGDQIVVTGPVGVTNKGETTVWALSVRMAAKALLPPPAKWEGLTDMEARYRQRYVDLWANPGVMKTLQMRMRIVDEIRAYLKGLGYQEVETPMMQVLHGGANARPFVTHHNALDMQLYLRIAPELYLKRLLVGGFRKVFELNRNFRNEGISPRHNPEFTMLEAYEAFGSYETMAEMVEGLVCHVATAVLGTLRIEHKNEAGEVVRTINLEGDLSKPAGQRWRRVRMVDLVEERTGWKFDGRPVTEAAPAVVAKLKERMGTIGKVAEMSGLESLVEVYEKLIEPTLVDPCFVTQVPSVMIPLARENREDARFADVYELAINGQEISPGYTELNDPDVQAKHFAHQVGDEAEKQKVDEDFLSALRYGMPPAGGMGMGVDRLVMMLTGAASIRDVILFPLLRPEGG